MRTGAVIVAAGMSSRMGDFKPMLSIGRISIAERVIATLQQSGITDIVMVTGFNAAVLERHLAGKARRSGKRHLKGPARRTAEDDRRFAESFERLIAAALAECGR